MPERGTERVHEVAVERWSSASTLPLRILHCGHVNMPELGRMYGQMFPCMTCDKPAPVDGLTLHVPDYVPDANLLWSAPGRKCTMVSVQVQHSDHLSFEQLLARVATGAHCVDLQGQRLRPQHVPRSVDSFLVWRATSAGCTVQQGTITLPKDGILLLTGYGLHFRHCTFSGGALMCAGTNFSAAFDQCSFDWCTLYAVHGASAGLHRCRFHRCTPAVVANGGATAARFTSCLFHNCQTGLIAEEGASITLHGSRVVDSSSALIANHDGSCVDLEHSDIDAIKLLERAVHGVTAGEGGSVRVRHCTVSGFTLGVLAFGPGAAAEVFDSSIRCSMRAVSMGVWGRVSVRNVEMTMAAHAPHATPPSQLSAGGETPQACAVAVADSVGGDDGKHTGGVAQLQRCSMHAPGGAGVQAFSGGRADVLQCAMACERDAVCITGMNAHMRVQSCAVNSTAAACRVYQASVLRVEDCRVYAVAGECAVAVLGKALLKDSELCSGRTKNEAAVVDGMDGSVTLHRCSLRGHGHGVLANRSTIVCTKVDFVRESNLAGSSSHSRGKHAPCAMMVVDCSLVMKRGRIIGYACGISAGVHVYDHVVHARVEGVQFEGCADAATFCANVAAQVKDCVFTCGQAARAEGGDKAASTLPEDTQLHGISLCDADECSVLGCTFEGPWQAVGTSALKPVRVADCEFRGAALRGFPAVQLHGPGTGAIVEDCRFSRVWSGVSLSEGCAVTVRRCVFGQWGNAGVKLQRGSRARVLDCRFSGIGYCMWLAGACELAVQDCVCERSGCAITADGGGNTVSAKRLIARECRSGVLTRPESGETSEGRAEKERTDVKLVDCTLSGVRHACGVDIPQTNGTRAVAFVRDGVEATLLRCKIDWPTVGVEVKGACCVRVRKSRVQGCLRGILVGDGCYAQFNRCPCCDGCEYDHDSQEERAEFWGALDKQWRAGTLARVTLEDVCVRQCSVSGVEVSAVGHLVAKRLRVFDCGITVARFGQFWGLSYGGLPGEKSQFEECWVAAGHAESAVPAGHEVTLLSKYQLGGQIGIQRENMPAGVRVVSAECGPQRWE